MEPLEFLGFPLSNLAEIPTISKMWGRAADRLADLVRFDGAGKSGLFDEERRSELARRVDALEGKLSQPLMFAGEPNGSLPAGLRRLRGVDQVKFLFAVGNVELLSAPAAGICGSRHASERGLSIASAVVKRLAQQNVVITSGYAAGVDMMAHLTALKEATGTVVVLPEGLGRFSVRRELRPYWDWSKVVVLSQFSMATPWKAWNAMRRNKTIMSLSKLMLVVEARLAGGTYDAGRVSLDYGVPVFAVDFGEGDEMSAGNQALIGMGAQPLRKSRSTGEPSLDALIEIIQPKNNPGAI